MPILHYYRLAFFDLGLFNLRSISHRPRNISSISTTIHLLIHQLFKSPPLLFWVRNLPWTLSNVQITSDEYNNPIRTHNLLLEFNLDFSPLQKSPEPLASNPAPGLNGLDPKSGKVTIYCRIGTLVWLFFNGHWKTQRGAGNAGEETSKRHCSCKDGAHFMPPVDINTLGFRGPTRTVKKLNACG